MNKLVFMVEMANPRLITGLPNKTYACARTRRWVETRKYPANLAAKDARQLHPHRFTDHAFEERFLFGFDGCANDFDRAAANGTKKERFFPAFAPETAHARLAHEFLAGGALMCDDHSVMAGTF